VLTKNWRQLNIGVDKILASTKYRGRQDIGVDKNTGVNKILALTKYSHRQNVGSCADYVQVQQSIFFLIWLAKSAVAGFF
jgi:phosphohistidine phosphatase SixA